MCQLIYAVDLSASRTVPASPLTVGRELMSRLALGVTMGRSYNTIARTPPRRLRRVHDGPCPPRRAAKTRRGHASRLGAANDGFEPRAAMRRSRGPVSRRGMTKNGEMGHRWNAGKC
jgi:hypothetical protein